MKSSKRSTEIEPSRKGLFFHRILDIALVGTLTMAAHRAFIKTPINKEVIKEMAQSGLSLGLTFNLIDPEIGYFTSKELSRRKAKLVKEKLIESEQFQEI